MEEEVRSLPEESVRSVKVEAAFQYEPNPRDCRSVTEGDASLLETEPLLAKCKLQNDVCNEPPIVSRVFFLHAFTLTRLEFYSGHERRTP